ncbi:hypothetical protein FRC17_009312 [Serendipita sp. 399]|nr:hypothetical protein FRC17_009312 [Serendipita sp. 399]
MRRFLKIKLPTHPTKRVFPPRLFRATISTNQTYSAREDKKSTYSLHGKQKGSCPKCKSPLPTQLPTCTQPACGYITPVPNHLSGDYFSLFGLPSIRDGAESSRNPFSIDVKELKNRFMQLQKVCHPDRWTQQGEEKAQVAANQSALLNKAYQTLLSPRLRAEYILSHNGVDITEMDNMDQEQELMMEVMEAREELENAEGEEDTHLRTERIETATAELEDAIGKEDWAQAKRSAIQLRYWESFKRAGQGLEIDH